MSGTVDADLGSDSAISASLANGHAVAVGAGTHTYRLDAQTVNGINAGDEATGWLTCTFVPSPERGPPRRLEPLPRGPAAHSGPGRLRSSGSPGEAGTRWPSTGGDRGRQGATADRDELRTPAARMAG